MKPNFATESALAEVVTTWLRADGWATFHEIECWGGRADIVAVRHGLVWLIETKLRAGRRRGAPREPTRFALFKAGQAVALVTARSRGWKWRIAARPGGVSIVAGRADLLEEAMRQAKGAWRHGPGADPGVAAQLLDQWEGRYAGT